MEYIRYKNYENGEWIDGDGVRWTALEGNKIFVPDGAEAPLTAKSMDEALEHWGMSQWKESQE